MVRLKVKVSLCVDSTQNELRSTVGSIFRTTDVLKCDPLGGLTLFDVHYFAYWNLCDDMAKGINVEVLHS